MEETIHKCCSADFPHDDLSLANPQGLQGGAYISKLKLLGKRVVLQTPRCTTKNGIIKTDKKIYCDLMFDADNDEVRDFFEQIGDKIKNLIFDKKDHWFHTDMDMDTIEYHWQQILRPYKGSKLLLRCNIKKPHRSKVSMQPSIQIYDEDESLLTIDDVKKEKPLMGLLHLSGLKFTSQSFSLEFFLEQAMILKDKVLDRRCRIQIDTNKIKADDTNDEDNVEQSSFGDSESDTSPKIPDASENITLKVTETATVSPPPSAEKETPLDLLSPSPTANIVAEDKEVEVDDEKTVVQDAPMVDETEIIAESLAETNDESLEKVPGLNEITLGVPDEEESLKLRKPNEVYMEIYKEVRRRAKEARKKAIEAYLEVKRIKSLYMLDEIEVDDSDDDDDILETLETGAQIVQ